MQRLETRKEEEKAAKILAVKEKMSKSGKDLYTNTCQTCHGEKADLKPYNTSRALIDLSLQDMQLAIRDYMIDDYDRGFAMIMKPYANMLNDKKMKEVYSYIKTLKPKVVKIEEAK